MPLTMRKANLSRLLARRVNGIFLSDFEQGEIGPDLFRHACLMGLEGWYRSTKTGLIVPADLRTGSKSRTASIPQCRGSWTRSPDRSVPTNGGRSNVDGPSRRANPDRRTHTQAVLHTLAVPHNWGCRIDRIFLNHHWRRRYNDRPANHEGLGRGSQLLDNDRRRRPVRVRVNFSLIARNFAIGRYRQFGGHCRRGKS